MPDRHALAIHLLTAAASRTRSAGVKFLALALACAGPLPVSMASQEFAVQPLEQIRSVAEAFVQAGAARFSGDVTIAADQLDSRLRLARCGQAPEAFLPPGGRIDVRTTVGIRCTGPKPWKLYVPVRMTVRGPMVVATRALSAGTTLTAADIKVVLDDLSRQPGGTVADVAHAIGQTLRRTVRAGDPLRPAMLKAPYAVRRGQQVTISAGGDTVAIKMTGEVLADARLGQRVRVRNRSSGRVVEGVVRSEDLVEVYY